MKIAMIGLRGIPATTGGVEHSVQNLAPRLVKLGCDVTVYCRSQYCPKKIISYNGVKLKYYRTLNTKVTETIVHTSISTLDSLFRDYDIVHFHAMGNGIFSIVPRIRGVKTVVTLHGLDYERQKWGIIAKTFLRFSERAISIFPNNIISVSTKIRDHYNEKYNKSVTYVPNGVEIINRRKLQSLKRFNVEENKYILFMSRIVPEKELHTLIEAFKELKTQHNLVIAGDSTHTDDYLKRAKQLGKGDSRIIFTGPLYDNDKIEAFSNCSFFVLPSTIEGLPIVLLEAMSFGICPLVSDIRENLDVIKDNGFSFKVRDKDDLRRKMEYMLKNDNVVRENGLQAKSNVQKEYNWDSISKQTLYVYEELLYGKKH